MLKAKQFYLSNIKDLNHIIGGSTAVKKQLPSFRDATDIDIMVCTDVFREIIGRIREEKFEKSDYGNGVFSIKFDDDSKLDIIIDNKYHKIVVIDNVEYLDLEEIIKYKFDLIRKNIEGKLFNEHNKHLKDLLFIFDNFKEYDISKKENKTEEIPF